MDKQQSDSVRNQENPSPASGNGYAVAYVRDRFAISASETAKTIARLAGLGEEAVQR